MSPIQCILCTIYRKIMKGCTKSAKSSHVQFSVTPFAVKEFVCSLGPFQVPSWFERRGPAVSLGWWHHALDACAGRVPAAPGATALLLFFSVF